MDASDSSAASTFGRLMASWHTYRRDGDQRFKLEAISAVEDAVRAYERALVGLSHESPPQDELRDAVRTVVLALNSIGGLDGRYGNFIETDDREILLPLLLQMASERGLDLAPGEDPTASYRLW